MAAEGASHLVSVVTLLGAAVIAVPLFKRFGFGSVLGYLAAGLAIGPFGFGVFNDPEGVIHLAELGVVMFLFIVGLEMKPSHIWGLRNHIFCMGAFQVSVIMAALFGILTLAGYPWQVAFVAGSGFVLSSSAIVMQELSDRGEMSTPKGQQIISTLIFEDLLIVPLLALVTFLSPIKTEADDLWQSIGIAGASITALVVAGLWLLNPLFKILAKTKTREVMTAAALLVVLGAALLMELGGLSMAMGAFVAGVLLSESSFRHQLEADIEPFRGLLLGLFFLGVGMSLNLQVVFENWVLILLGVFIFSFTKGACVYLAARATRKPHAHAIDRAFTMAHGGEFAFVLFASAAGQHLIDEKTQANLTAIVVFSMALSSVLMLIFKRYIVPRLSQAEQEQEADHIDSHHPTIIIGLGRYGQIVNHLLMMTGSHPTVIDKDATLIAAMKKRGIKSYYGDASRAEILRAAGVESAELLVIAIDNKDQATHIVELARKMNPQIKIIARAYDRLHVFDLYNAGADIQVRETFDSALRTGKKVLLSYGLDPEMVEEIGEAYFYRDRHSIKLMAEVYDPKINRFDNKEMLRLALENDQETMLEIQQIMQKDRHSIL